MELTHRWLKRCMARIIETDNKYNYTQSLFPIVQGGTFEDLRKQSCEYISATNAAGNAIGGLSVGEPEESCMSLLIFAAIICLLINRAT